MMFEFVLKLGCRIRKNEIPFLNGLLPFSLVGKFTLEMKLHRHLFYI